jgi:methylenetetrahydrofolate reductase (NADPH)
VREKVEAGAEYLVTQMFFDNAHYFAYVERCRAAGIEVPIIPGLKVITTKSQLRSIPRTFNCDIPRALSDEIEAANPKHVSELGVRWTVAQARELMERGVPSVHFYVMLNSKAIGGVMQALERG